MNRKNLDTVLNRYAEKFEELNRPDGRDEGAKWRAVTCFQEHWNVDRADFRSMFEASMQEAGSLLDGTMQQAIAGVRQLLARETEVEMVRECFRFLLSDDYGNLSRRQERINFFVEQMNERTNRFVRETIRYPQTMNYALCYLSLWRPEENYMFQAGSAQSWANCVEYGDDFGTGKKFSLEKYYKMCEELREELLDREDILNMHGKRMEREAKGFDDQLHLMVFEVQACAESCQLYAGMGLGRVSKKERIQRAENYAAVAETENLIREKQRELKELESRDILLPDITGQVVHHKTYGAGTVKACQNDMLTVTFGDTDKKFKYSLAFTKGHLILLNGDALPDGVAQMKQMLDQKARLEKEIKQLKASIKM